MNTISVLHADDEPAFADLVATFLEREREEIVVLTETDPYDARERFVAESREIDCVVSDYNMPGMDGLELLGELRAIDPEIPFVLFTGHGNEAIASEAITAGVTDYLRKETGTDQYAVLANRVVNAVSKRRAETERAHTEARYERLVEGSPAPIVLYNAERIVYANEAAADFLGADDPDDVVGTPPIEFVHPDDREQARQRMAAILDAGEPAPKAEERFVGFDGETRYATISGAPVTVDGEVLAQVVLNDVTEHRRAEGGLREEQAFVESVFDAIPDVLYAFDEDRTMLRWNEQLPTLTGYSDAEIAGMTPLDFVADEDMEVLTETSARVFGAGVVATDEVDLVTKAGEYIPTELTAAPITDEEGTIVGLTGTGRDVTDRKEREAELEMTRARFQSLTENTTLGVVTIDADSTIRYANDAVEELFGYPPDELVGDSLSIVIPDRLEESHFAAITRYLREGERGLDWEWLELPARHRAGHEVSVGISFGEYVADGEHRFTGVIRDISDRKEHEKALERYERIVETTDDLVYTLDADGRITFINQAFTDLTGYDPAEAIDESAALVMDEMDFERFEREIRDLIETGERETTLDVALVTADGERVPCEDHLVLHFADSEDEERGEFRGTVGIVREISDRKEHERELERSEDLLEKTQRMAAVGGWELDLRADDLRWTDEVNRIYGFEADYEPSLTEAIDSFVPEDRATLEDAMERAIAEGESYDLTLQLRTVEDELRWVRTLGDPLRESGETVVLQGTIQDITDRRERERELRSTSDTLSTLLSSIPAGVLAEDGEREILFANRSFCELFSIRAAPDDLVGADCVAAAESVMDLFVDSERFVEGNTAYVAEKRTVSREEFALVDGRTIERSGTPIPVTEGADRYLWLYHDITERKQVEETLRALHEGTREMMAATSREDVCSVAAETSKRVLGHSITVVRLLADDGETLVPTARTTETRERIGDRPTYSIYDTPAGEAFREGVPRIYDDLATLDEATLDASYDRGNSRAAMYVPLGAHGVISIADTDVDRFDRSDLQLAKVLGANAETALDRVSHERTLEALHEGTRAMMDAQTPAEVHELIVETARDALGLELSGFWSYDPDDVCLQPTAFTDIAYELFGEFPTYTAGTSLSWEAFVTGELAVFDDVSTEPGVYDPETPIASEMIVPLGDYGVLNSGSTDPGQFDALNVSAARILAANAEAALARAEREVLLRDRETQLGRERDNLAALFENVPDPMYRYRRENGAVIPKATNPAFERVFGYDADRVVGRPITETIVPAEGIDEHEELTAVAVAGDTLDTEIERLTATGRRTFLLRNAPIDASIDTPSAGYAIYTDVTERHEAEQYRRQLYDVVSDAELTSAERIRGLLDLGRERLGLETGFLTRIDEDTQRIVAARGPHEAIEPGSECPLPEAYCRETIEADSPVTIGHAAEAGWKGDPAYERFDLETYLGSKLTIDGTTYGTVCFADREPRDRDFSAVELAFVDLVTRGIASELERRRYERELERQNERLEQFASVLSHDLRNPLSIAEGYLDFIPEEGNEDPLEKVRTAHGRMERIIEDVLALTRQGTTVTETRTASLAEAAETAWEHVETHAATVLIPDDLGTIEADRSRLETLFENLFRNAIEHAGENATVRIERTNTGFAVSDDGPGIEPDDREQVFEYGHTTGSGTGLGLSIVRTVVDAHGWEVAAAASDLGGARFEISTPDAASR